MIIGIYSMLSDFRGDRLAGQVRLVRLEESELLLLC